MSALCIFAILQSCMNRSFPQLKITQFYFRTFQNETQKSKLHQPQARRRSGQDHAETGAQTETAQQAKASITTQELQGERRRTEHAGIAQEHERRAEELPRHAHEDRSRHGPARSQAHARPQSLPERACQTRDQKELHAGTGSLSPQPPIETQTQMSREPPMLLCFSGKPVSTLFLPS